MKRGEIWWSDQPKPSGRRPVVLLSRDEAYMLREMITVAPLTTNIRNLAVEVRLGAGEGLPKESVANLDSIGTIPKKCLTERVGELSQFKLRQLNDALKFALGLDD